MQAHIYVTVQGDSADLHAFHARASKVIGGEVRHRRRAGTPLAQCTEHWVSHETPTTAVNAAARLSELLGILPPLLNGLQKKPGVHVLAHVDLYPE